ncbi:MAG: hypothetical protein CR975_04100 [Gammaproteobacteria bacterium]|nr:MAG: hypothetical protein CR975_04100 [Gammaproteobacteria bacterium]
MNNRLLLTMAFGTTMLLTGCDSLLYGNSLAPIFSANKTPAQTAPPVINSPMKVDSVEKLDGSTGIVVEQAKSNPYGNAPVRPENVSNKAGQPKTTAAAAATSATAGPAATTPATTATNPRIREGQDVLAEENNANKERVTTPAKQPAAQRPAAIAKRPAETVKEEAAEKTTAVNTAAEAATPDTAAVAKADTAAVTKPAPSTPKTATRALLQEAKAAVSSGDYDKAASALERAHRIEPGNAKILYDIAQIRYAQGNYRQAASFASKAATYSDSPALSKKVWSLLSKSRKELGNSTGAAAAAQKAASF